MRRSVVVALALAVVLAGCSLSLISPPTAGDGEELGEENGYEADQKLDVTTEDGLNESELNAVKNRAMARLEVLRQREFTEDVPVRLITRQQYRQNQSTSVDVTHSKWNNQVWEGLFLVGESSNITNVFDRTLGSSVLGYYSPDKDEIVIVSDSETPKLDRGTLVHELVHALQDQQFGLNESMSTQDRQLARDGVVEGEAVLLSSRYQRRCGGEWACVTVPSSGGGGGDVPNPGVFLVLVQPYNSGPGFVGTVQRRGGWNAVDDMHEEYPASTEQTLHPKRYPGEQPVNVTVTDRSNGEWNRFDHDPVADTVGEASIYAMFVSNEVGESVGWYSYSHPASKGWGGDSLVPYRNGDQFGYVWETTWDTRKDARQFHEAYVALLEKHGATERGNGVYVVPDSSAFGDAFRVVRDGKRVRIVNGPTVDALDGIHAR